MPTSIRMQFPSTLWQFDSMHKTYKQKMPISRMQQPVIELLSDEESEILFSSDDEDNMKTAEIQLQWRRWQSWGRNPTLRWGCFCRSIELFNLLHLWLHCPWSGLLQSIHQIWLWSVRCRVFSPWVWTVAVVILMIGSQCLDVFLHCF